MHLVGCAVAWSATHWIARTSDEQIVSNVTACKLALTERAHDFLTANGRCRLSQGRGGRRQLAFPADSVAWRRSPIRIEDLSDLVGTLR